MKKGIDIGGSFIKVLWEDGRREKVYVRDVSQNKEAFVEKLREIIREGNPTKAGIAVAGFTSLEGVVYRSPNIPALDGVDIKRILLEEGISGIVLNDVSAGAFGEWYYDHRDSKNLLFVAIGTGLGAGFVCEGEVFLGSCGSALELGHHIVEKDGELCSCGRRGCLEAYCSSYGLERIYKKLSGESLKDYQIVLRAKEGDQRALEAIKTFKDYLTIGLMNAIHILNPDRVVLGGGLIQQLREFMDDLETRLRGTVETLPSQCFKLSFSKCGEFCMARGALALTLMDDR
ncbi:ROK family protein [Thermocrinis jamiesonii]|jgi:Transcriptional regulator/sugar kinase|uniref:ROK family protein n=1 Tax=Thermocrinis jamiesonii TaxID=1302351 RepID=UPI000497F298|nr:ROK family protein [Thermocrinis jamiesonii]